MNQSSFAKYIGVSRKTVSTMKSNGEIVVNNKMVDVDKSIKKLKSLGRIFDGHTLVKRDDICKSDGEEKVSRTVFDEDVIPDKNLSNISDDEREEYFRLILEEKKAREEAEVDGVDHDKELLNLDMSEVKMRTEYWRGLAIKQKTELASEELVYKKDVASAQMALARVVREKIESRPRLAFRLVGKKVEEIERILEKDSFEILDILSGINE